MTDAKLPESKLVDLPLSKVRPDGGTQTRASMSQETIDDYAALMRDEVVFAAIDVFHDTKANAYWLADGFHRFHAAKQAGLKKLLARVQVGDQRRALLFALGANGNHGLRRTTADKQKAIRSLLLDEEWRMWSDRQIARHCGVDPNTVAKVRAQMEASAEIPQTNVRKSADGITRDTSKINRDRAAAPRVVSERVEEYEEPTTFLEEPPPDADDGLDDEKPPAAATATSPVAPEAPAASAPRPMAEPPPKGPSDVVARMVILREHLGAIASHMLAAGNEWAALLRKLAELGPKVGLVESEALGSYVLNAIQPTTEHGQTIRRALPYAVCPTCEGDLTVHCDTCRGARWVNRQTHENATAAPPLTLPV